jgi:putative CocE/NonD family hydrolase
VRRTPFEGSPLAFDYVVERNARVAMRDGTRLATDVYRPALDGQPVAGRFPVVLERTPYDRSRPWHAITARYFARRGYVAVVQDVRGRYASEGEFYFLRHEAEDGYDTLVWVGRQPWCDGEVGTLGLSYTTANQQALAVLNPPHLRTQVLCDGGYNYYTRTMRHAGTSEYGIFLPYVWWMARTSKEALADAQVRRALDEGWTNLTAWIRRLPLRPGESPLRLVPAYERWFFDMLYTADYGEYWKNPGYNLEEFVDRYPDIPLFLETSWYGHHIWATLAKWEEFGRRHRSPRKLLLGTWLHGFDAFTQSYAGDVDFGAAAALENLNDVRLRWFDRWLKGLATGIDEEPPVDLFVMGGGSGRRNVQGRLDHGGHWRREREWPLTRRRETPYYLHPGGVLSADMPAAEAPPSTYTYNPADPVPTIGGNFQNLGVPGLLEGGGFDQRGRRDLTTCADTLPLAARRDVLVFRTPPLGEGLEVTGPLTVRLWVSSSALDTDFTAKLIDEYPPSEDYPEGYALNIADSILRVRYRTSRERPEPLEPGAVYEIAIEPQATSNYFAPGHRLRLDVSSSNFPHFDVNPNTGEPSGRERRLVVAHQVVYHDADRPSHIVLPIVPREPGKEQA